MMMVVMLMLVVVLVVVVMVVVVVFMLMLMVMVVMVMLTLLLAVDSNLKPCSCDTAFDCGNCLNLYIGYAKSVELAEKAIFVVDKLIQRG
jgi:hypothetical protein